MLCASVFLVLSALVLKILITANVFLPLEFTPHSLSTVSGSEGHWGNEDLQLLGSGSAYIGTSDDRHGWMTPTGDTKVIMGMLAPAWAPPTEGSKMKALRGERQGFLTVGVPRAGGGWEQRELGMLAYPHADLHPHGLYVSERETFRGLPLVYAVNHRADEAGAVITDEISVCAASVRDGTCRYLYGIMSPELVSLNDVVSLSESPGGGGAARGEIYATRWRKNQVGTLMNVLETYLQLPLASVVHCTYEVPSAESLAAGGAGRIVQAECETAAAGIKMSNGISLGREAMDKGQGSGTVELYVAASLSKAVHKYAAGDGALELVASFPLTQLADNLSWSTAGRLIVAGHPKAFAFRDHAMSPLTTVAPCMVESIDVETGDVKILFADDGRRLSGCSVAVDLGRDGWWAYGGVYVKSTGLFKIAEEQEEEGGCGGAGGGAEADMGGEGMCTGPPPQ